MLKDPRSRIGAEHVENVASVAWGSDHATLVANATGTWSPTYLNVATINAGMPTPSASVDIDGAPGAPRECIDAFIAHLKAPNDYITGNLNCVYPDKSLASANPDTRHLAAFFRGNDFFEAVQRVSRGENPTVVVSQMHRSPWQDHHKIPAEIKALDEDMRHALQQDIAVLELEAYVEARSAKPEAWDAWLQTLGYESSIETKAHQLAAHLIQLAKRVHVDIVFLQELRCKELVLELVQQEYPYAQVYVQTDETPLVPTVGIMTFARCDTTPIRVDESVANRIAMAVVQFDEQYPLTVGTCHGDANGLTATAGELFQACDVYGGDFQGGKEGADEETLQSQLPLMLSSPIPTRVQSTQSPLGYNQGIKNRFGLFKQ